ncbi:phospho-sugar mutase [Thaumasiovibrio sp. DFM-14]|uniref:phospho-sugar mutase n=1 Tax=Thaumasiovibrio sp. DFM-14 TaxID=3384792 RepID=UPI0039A1E732
MYEQAKAWLARDIDDVSQAELSELIDRKATDELILRFSSRLAFGTAGLRGVVGAGPNRMNRLVIIETATGLGHYLQQHVPDAKQRGVIIGYDGRVDSKQFARDAAEALMAQGFNVYLTEQVAATPIVAFGITRRNAAAGIVVTASHNPPQYNGFKVYWHNGAQIIPPHDAGIAAKIEEAAQQPVRQMPLPEGEKQGLLHWVGDVYYQQYKAAILCHPYSASITPSHLTIAYTAMHGVGAEMAESLLKEAGFHSVYSVASQREPDGTFPTVNFPNPEEPGAMDLVEEEAECCGADLAFANDPDADRIAVSVKTPQGNYQRLSGDQFGCLLADYLLSQYPNGMVGNTIVSSKLLQQIATQHGGVYFQTLTGFKWLSNVAIDKQSANHPFLMAYEEAIGYCVGSTVWDKDGLSALLIFAQMTEILAQQGITVWDKLAEIYRQHGFYCNAQHSIATQAGQPLIGDKLRAQPPTDIAGIPIRCCHDFATGLSTHTDGTQNPVEYPLSDILIYDLDDGSRVIVRPSGTEPKVKCYYEVVIEMNEGEDFFAAQRRANAKMTRMVEAHQRTLR